jgi:hypothetical protein
LRPTGSTRGSPGSSAPPSPRCTVPCTSMRRFAVSRISRFGRAPAARLSLSGSASKPPIRAG